MGGTIQVCFVYESYGRIVIRACLFNVRQPDNSFCEKEKALTQLPRRGDCIGGWEHRAGLDAGG